MCSLEFPDLEIVSNENPGLFVLGLAGGETDDTLAAFIDQTGVTFPIAWDEATFRNSVAFPRSLSPYPRQVLIDRQGVIRYAAAEYDATELDLVLAEVLAE